MNRQKRNRKFLWPAVLLLVSVQALASGKLTGALARADTCVNPVTVTRNSKIQPGQIITDEACLSVTLEPGFETAAGFEYVAGIGNGTTGSLIGQVNNGENEAINLLIRPRADRIMLRWIPESDDDWNDVSKKSYTLNRMEFTGGNWVQSSGFPKTINGIKSADLSSWSPLFSTDSLYYVAYHATLDANSASMEVFFRYLSAVSAFNANYDIAVKSGHGFTDLSIVGGRQYRYQVSAVKTGSVTISTGAWLEVTAGENGSLPKVPVEITRSANQQKPSLTLKWKANSLIRYYGSYNLMRSTDGTNFVKLNKEPIFFMNTLQAEESGTSSPLEHIYAADTLPNKTQLYHYKVVGKSYFNESIDFYTHQVRIQKEYLYAPAIDSVKNTSATQRRIHWKFPAEGNVSALDSILHATSWSVHVSNNDQTGFQSLATGISKASRSYTFNKSALAAKVDTLKSYYFKMYALTKDSDTLKSFAFMVIPPDRTPPAKPQNLRIDTLDLVTGQRIVLRLSWTPNTENDLLGYVVKRKIGPSDSLHVISGFRFTKSSDSSAALTPDLAAYATDTIALNVTYPVFYYSVNAYDMNYNASDSAQIAYLIPDRKRPMPPMIRKILVVKENNVYKARLSLTYSPDKTARHKILRKEENTAWVEVANLTALQRDTSYTDQTVTVNKIYYYSFIAIDPSNNQSCFSETREDFTGNYDEASCYQILEANIRMTPSKPVVISTFTAVSDTTIKIITLNWTLVSGYQTSGAVREFEIYKSEYTSGTTPLPKEALLKISRGAELKFIDEFPEKGKVNRYMIRAVTPEGKLSDWKTITINY